MKGCLTCRQRHLKCDKTGRECLRCQKSGRKCVPAPSKPEQVSFRHGQNPSLRSGGPPRYGENDLSFPMDQIWVHIPAHVTFEDETSRIAADYEVMSVTNSPELTKREIDGEHVAPAVLAAEGAQHFFVEHGSVDNPVPRPQMQMKPAKCFLPSLALILAPSVMDPQEAFLLRHFRQILGPWLDGCDFSRQYSVNVVEMAPNSPLLLNACLAASARHLSRTANSVHRRTADKYHDRCIAILLPLLDNARFEIDIDVLLAATVILRFFEQLSYSTPCSDQQRHLLAGSVYISSRPDGVLEHPLAKASFWAFAIQNIQFALANRHSLRLSFDEIDKRLQPFWNTGSVGLHDRDWSQKAIWLLAETIELCFGSDDESYLRKSDALKDRISSWQTARPATFRPLHYAPVDRQQGRLFPTVWYLNSWHSTAIQHLCMAKVLLLEKEVESISVSDNSQLLDGTLKEELLNTLGIILGIGLSTDEPSARTMACHAICACGTWIEDTAAQEIILDLIRRTESENGWPWTYLIQKLCRQWGREF